jgi:hypothetical protein
VKFSALPRMGEVNGVFVAALQQLRQPSARDIQLDPIKGVSLMAEKIQHIVLKVTDVETGAEQIAGDFTAVPGFGFCCSCSSSSLTSVPQPQLKAQLPEATTHSKAKQ